MLQKLVTLTGLGALVLLGASVAVAQPVGPPDEGPGPRGIRGPGRVLGLSEEQQAAAREIFEQQRPQRQALHEAMRENRKALHELLESGADPCTVGEIVVEGHALEERARALREESKKALSGLLNEEQKSRLETLEAARDILGPKGRPGMEGPRGGGWGPPGGGPDWE